MNIIPHKMVLTCLAIACIIPAGARLARAVTGDLPERRTYYVNNVTGSESYDGLLPKPKGKSGPCATIMQAVKQASVGAVISIANTGVDYREKVNLEGYHKGTAATPLVLDGNGATVNGLLEVPTDRWEHVKDDIYSTVNRLPNGKHGEMPSSNWLAHYSHQGWFTERQAPDVFFIDGKPAPYTRSLETIPQGGFFYDTQGHPRKIYVRLPVGKKIGDIKIEFPQNQGVYISDDYVVVRNLRSIYSSDDGFSGFWGIGVVFENINGSYNADQGFSVHGTSVSLVDGGLFERNGGCGICDVMSSTSVFRNCVVRDNMICGAMMMGLNHSFRNCRFYGNDTTQVMGVKDTSVLMTNCLIDGLGENVTGADIITGRLDHCTVVNCREGVKMESGSIRNSIIADCGGMLLNVPAFGPNLAMDYTVLGLGSASVGGETFGKDKLAAFLASRRNLSSDVCDSLDLKGPVFGVPAGSKYEKWAEYSTPPGATLSEYKGWTP